MNATRCRICGESLLDQGAAPRCPYCAAAAHYIGAVDDFASSENRILPTETERRDLEDLTEVARTLARTALGAAEATSDDGRASVLRRLAWVHAEHVRVLCLLASETHGPEWLRPATVESDERLALSGIEMRLAEAASLYERATSRATAPRVREVLDAFADADASLAELVRKASRAAG